MLPPYGKNVLDHLKSNSIEGGLVWICTGKYAWRLVKNILPNWPNSTLCFPSDYEPTAYQWPVNGCTAILMDSYTTSPDYINRFVRQLFCAGADYILYVNNQFETTFIKRI